MTESLTKEERIQLSTQWPPDTKLFLKLLRVHDEQQIRSVEAAADICVAEQRIKSQHETIVHLRNQLDIRDTSWKSPSGSGDR